MMIEHQFEEGVMGADRQAQAVDAQDGALDEVTKARAVIAAEQARAVEACGREIETVLAKYGMTLDAVASLQLRPTR
ncbi:MAG: hypothetical protein ACRDRN_11835 [Sciscionella sp.]